MVVIATARLGMAMLRTRLAPIALVLLMLALTACSNWDAAVNGNIAVSNDPRAGADVDHTGLVWWETVGTAGVDATTADDTAAAEDATTGSDDALVVDILANDTGGDDADGFDGQTPDALGDAGQDGLIAPDGVLDAANASDGVLDVFDPCAGGNRPIGCNCVNSQECASGLCVYGVDGLVCSPSCANVVCPAGWACTTPAMVCKPLADASAQDASVADGTATDVPTPDDAASPDSQTLDGWFLDGVANDVWNQDSQALDATDSDWAAADVVDALDDATDLGDASVPDGELVDVAVVDTAADVSVDTDGLTGLDWQGYPDAAFPDDADIYGGAINSCLSLYLYQQETCGKANPTAACIDSVAGQGSLYANYLFEPVRACQDAFCVDLCATATDETCMNQCIGKNCPNQFLSCVSNDQQGTADCKTTFSCAMGYPGKLLTIGAKCYANGTLGAQLQVGGLISCETKPNTDSCFQAIGDCYDQGAAATNTCMQTITCTQNCASNQECVWQCLGKATPTARTAIDALGDCMVTVCTPKCNGDQNCQNTCISTDCSTPFGYCVAN